MKIETRPITSIKPYDQNPRINDSAVAAVASSIREFGFRQPIVLDKDGVIVVGHTRWKAAQQLGLTEVPVHVALDLTPEAARAYRIADNKTGEIAANPAVELCYVSGGHDQVRIAGRAEVVADRALLESIWAENPLLRHYLGSVDNPELLVYCVVPERVRFMREWALDYHEVPLDSSRA